MIGRILGGYRITEQIGMGGMATVYKAFDSRTERNVAIKVLPPHYARDPMFQTRFDREAKAIAKLEHVHILPVFSYGEEDGIAYMVMRYLDSGTLADLLKKQGALPLVQTSQILKQIASALDYAHGLGILHRDVKPNNILIDNQGNAFLTDFGIAKIVEGSSADLTGSGIIGTPKYMSPEQCLGQKDLTPATDQYALGIVVYEIVTGQAPFEADTPLAVIQMHLNEPLAPPHRFRTDLPSRAENAILKALSRRPEDRFATCGDFAKAFDKAIGSEDATYQLSGDRTVIGDTTPALPIAPTYIEKTSPLTPKPVNYKWIGLIAALISIVGIGLLLAFGLSDDSSEETQTTATELAQATLTLTPSLESATDTVEPSEVPPTDTAEPDTDTPEPDTATPIPPTDTVEPSEVPPTDTPEPDTDTPVPPTDTRVPPTDTKEPSPVPPTARPTATDGPALPGFSGGDYIENNTAWTVITQEFDGVSMVLVPIGCFMMGSSEENADANADEKPATQICFSEPFWIDQYEVTNQQFADFEGEAASLGSWTEAQHPRETITWIEAQAFCEKRAGRLPTEAEWEYAARGPESWIYPWGNEFNRDYVISVRNSNDQTAEVGSKPDGIAWVGAYDLSGNVWEWTLSVYSPYPYVHDDGRESLDNDGTLRVAHGGAWNGGPQNLRGSYRHSSEPDHTSPRGGFRCVRAYEE